MFAESRLIPACLYGFGAEAQPRSNAAWDEEVHLDNMDKWDLCDGSTGRAQGPFALPASYAVPSRT